MSWYWYLMALHPRARDRMLAEVDDVLGTSLPTADDLGAAVDDRLFAGIAALQFVGVGAAAGGHWR